jgi:hypothetical protein
VAPRLAFSWYSFDPFRGMFVGAPKEPSVAICALAPVLSNSSSGRPSRALESVRRVMCMRLISR